MPGMTNRILKWFSQRIFVSFEEAKKYFPEKKTVVTGNPIRKEILCPFREDRRLMKKEDRFTLLIFGGSAGAHRINRGDDRGAGSPSRNQVLPEDHSSNRKRGSRFCIKERIEKRGLRHWSGLSSRTSPPTTRSPIWSSAGQERVPWLSWRSAERRPSSSLIPMRPMIIS